MNSVSIQYFMGCASNPINVRARVIAMNRVQVQRRRHPASYAEVGFDAGEDVSGEVDWEKARRPNLALKRVNVDFPASVIVEDSPSEICREGRRQSAVGQKAC